MSKATEQTFQIGDRVKYRVEWLRSVGAYTGPLPFQRGTVVEIQNRNNWVLIGVDFGGNPYEPQYVNAKNLTLAGDPESGSY